MNVQLPQELNFPLDTILGQFITVSILIFSLLQIRFNIILEPATELSATHLNHRQCRTRHILLDLAIVKTLDAVAFRSRDCTFTHFPVENQPAVSLCVYFTFTRHCVILVIHPLCASWLKSLTENLYFARKTICTCHHRPQPSLSLSLSPYTLSFGLLHR